MRAILLLSTFLGACASRKAPPPASPEPGPAPAGSSATEWDACVAECIATSPADWPHADKENYCWEACATGDWDLSD